jgi:hypothetical protein
MTFTLPPAEIKQFITESKAIIGQPIDELPGTTNSNKLRAYISKYIRLIPKKSLTETRLRALSKWIVQYVPNLSTANTLFVTLRKVLRTRTEDQNLLFALSAGKEAYQKRKENAEESLLAKKPVIINIKQYLQLIKKLSSSPNPYDNLLAVCMSIGSRCQEVFHKSTYKALPDGIVEVSGFLKARASTKHVTTKPSVGLTPDELVALVSRIRSSIPVFQNSRMAQVYIDNNLTCSKARDSYGHVSYELFADKDTQTLPSWIHDVLNHSSIGTSVNYFRTQIV